MKVLFVNRMAAMVRGGGETFDLEISAALQQLGVETHLLTGLPILGSAQVELHHPHVHYIRSPYSGGLPWDRIPGGWRLRQLDFWMFERAAARWALKHQDEFDIIQVCELPIFVNSWRAWGGKTPMVMRMPGPQAFTGFGEGAERNVDVLMASGTSIEHYQREGIPCHNIPNGVNPQVFCPGPGSREEWGLPRFSPVVLCVARLQACKNHSMLIEAFHHTFSKQPNARLLLAGGGPLRHELERQCRSLGEGQRIRFLGDVPNHKLPSLYQTADFSVISSNYESFSFAALESMACGCPLITTDTEWVPGLIERTKGGLTVPVGDVEAMGGAMIELLSSDQSRLGMGNWARSRVLEQHSWEASAHTLVGLYDNLTL